MVLHYAPGASPRPQTGWALGDLPGATTLELYRGSSQLRSPMSERAPSSQSPRRGEAMAKSYYSTVFDQHAGQVWNAIRDFGSYE